MFALCLLSVGPYQHHRSNNQILYACVITVPEFVALEQKRFFRFIEIYVIKSKTTISISDISIFATSTTYHLNEEVPKTGGHESTEKFVKAIK